MYNHAPENYICPICLGVQGIENKDTLIRQSDIVYKDDLVTAFITSFFIGDNNNGHVIVVPNKHYENIYDLPDSTGQHIFDIAKKLAIAIRETYNCDGITTFQNNEPAGSQHAFHYHFHIFPRYKNDNFLGPKLDKQVTTPEQRLPYARKLINFLKKDD